MGWQPAKVHAPGEGESVSLRMAPLVYISVFLLKAMMHISSDLLFSLWFNYEKRNLGMKEVLCFFPQVLHLLEVAYK